MNDEAVYRTAPATPGLLNIGIYCDLYSPLILKANAEQTFLLVYCTTANIMTFCRADDNKYNILPYGYNITE